MKNKEEDPTSSQFSDVEKWHIKRDKRNDLIIKVLNRVIIGTIVLLVLVFYAC